ncbi:NAD(P)-binding protein [Fusarium austroafricanum]|uniref:NAD(P)-binding protein n=1 Tax=Fusarium austroafricanum TaxID=2364996 RepID=A0A8H4JJ04_9HYPO|nr:NAD(P)-binding protein [Fusarium austroafricanum]
MTTSLSGKIALVTGSSRSIGAAIAKRLADDGANVVVNYVTNSQAAGKLVDSINTKRAGAAIAIKADVSTVAGGQMLLHETIKSFGKIDIIVLNAAIMGSKPLAEIDEQYFDDHMNANVKGQLFLVKEAAPLLTSGSRIIFLSSSLTRLSSVLPNALVYIATKGAIEQLSRALAKDLGARGITVNTVAPGPTDTDLFRQEKSESFINHIASLAPSKRLGQPDEIAPVVSFLASPAAGWINGQIIVANGGYVV